MDGQIYGVVSSLSIVAHGHRGREALLQVHAPQILVTYYLWTRYFMESRPGLLQVCTLSFNVMTSDKDCN